MPPKPPVFVLVHGLAHGSWMWNPLESSLATAGLRALTVDLPSTVPPGGDTSSIQTSMLPDVQTVCAAIDAVLDEGDDVVVVAHSYAGTVVGEAVGTLLETVDGKEAADNDNKHHASGAGGLASRLLHGDRGKGRGRVRWLVYIAAYPLPKGVAMWNIGDGLEEAEPTKKLTFLDIKDGVATPNADAAASYMGDLPEAERAQWATRLGSFSLGIAATPATAVPGWVRVPATFVRTLRDIPFPPAFQARLIERARAYALQVAAEDDKNATPALVPFGDKELGVIDVDAAHNVMLSQTDLIKDLLVKIVGRLEKEH